MMISLLQKRKGVKNTSFVIKNEGVELCQNGSRCPASENHLERKAGRDKWSEVNIFHFLNVIFIPITLGLVVTMNS